MNRYAEKAETVAATILGQHFATSNTYRQTLATYLHFAGIETGYGYFAPNVPGSYRLVFELRYPDGHVEVQLPRVNSEAAGIRIAGLLDKIGRTSSDALREHLVKAMAVPVWREHPEVKTMRAVLSAIVPRSVADLQRGQTESYQFLYAYDFSLSAEPAESTKR